MIDNATPASDDEPPSSDEEGSDRDAGFEGHLHHVAEEGGDGGTDEHGAWNGATSFAEAMYMDTHNKGFAFKQAVQPFTDSGHNSWTRSCKWPNTAARPSAN